MSASAVSSARARIPTRSRSVIVSSISRHVGGLRVQLEPPLNVSLKAELGAERALGVDISNACAGMMTGVFILNDLIRQGRIRRGMVVSA